MTDARWQGDKLDHNVQCGIHKESIKAKKKTIAGKLFCSNSYSLAEAKGVLVFILFKWFK